MGTMTDTAATTSLQEPAFQNLRITCKEALAQDIILFELRHPEGADLPAFTPGAHLSVRTPGGLLRSYSLCGDSVQLGRYQIAVKRDATGRGGSISMADEVQVGDLLAVSAPRNAFELTPRASNYIFVAGGIGITPILAMMRHLKNIGGNNFKLYYCTRDAQSTAFLDELTGPEFAAHVKIHHDHGDIDQALDLWPVFEKPGRAHVYCCGPRGLMDSVRDMTGHWPSGSIHFESFGVDAQTLATNTPFTVRLAKSHAQVEVSAEQTLLEALRASGYRVPSSCESGTCGSCKTRLLDGQAEHRDMVLDAQEQDSHIMVCVSRARSAELVLDL